MMPFIIILLAFAIFKSLLFSLFPFEPRQAGHEPENGGQQANDNQATARIPDRTNKQKKKEDDEIFTTTESIQVEEEKDDVDDGSKGPN